MKITKCSQLKHGMRVKCKIDGVQIGDARISIDKNGDAHICQNVWAGTCFDGDRLGYKYAWFLGDKYDDWDRVADLESLDGLRAAKVGDILIDDDSDEAKVLEVLQNGLIRSYINDFEQSIEYKTFEELERQGWKLKEQEEPETEKLIEVTLQEIADMKGIPVEQLRIKDED